MEGPPQRPLHPRPEPQRTRSFPFWLVETRTHVVFVTPAHFGTGLIAARPQRTETKSK